MNEALEPLIGVGALILTCMAAEVRGWINLKFADPPQPKADENTDIA
jgi:hypothetical protein